MNIIVVDEQDEVIGFKERSEIDFSKDIYRVSCLWIVNSKGEILIARRSNKKEQNPNKWGPSVAGTNDEGETYEENIYKEVREELGVEGLSLKVLRKIFIHSKARYFCAIFISEIDRKIEDFILQENEVDEVMWISREDLKRDMANNPDDYVFSMGDVLSVLG